MEHNELKPCPFCGYVPTIEKTEWDGYALTDDHKRGCFFRYQNGCNNGRASSFNKHSIIETWNRRAYDQADTVKKMQEKLKEEIYYMPSLESIDEAVMLRLINQIANEMLEGL